MTKNVINTTTHNVAWLYKRFQADELQINAPFQRNPVWSNKQKAYLIDTILRSYPIPELYMQEYVDANGDDVYIVVDGQQRIRACIEYLDGKFGLDPEDSPNWAEKRFSELSERERLTIFNYDFVVRTLKEMPEEQLRFIFQRLNRNTVALNKQELRHATYWGSFIKCIEKIANNELWSSLGVFTPSNFRRMLDIEFISEIAIAYLHGLQNKKESLDNWYKSYEEEFPKKEELEEMVAAVLKEIHTCMPDISETRWKKKSDFYTLFLVFAEFKDALPFSKSARTRLGDHLRKFGHNVDQFLADPEKNRNASKSVKNYSGAVERAASDLGSRRKRRAEVFAILKRWAK